MLNLTTTASELSDSESLTVSCPTPPSTAISEHSLLTGTPEAIRAWLMSSAEDSPVNRFPTQESGLALTTPATCGLQLSNASASYDPATRSWRTSQGWLLADILAPSWETWPKAGIVSGGEFFQQPNWERRISEIGSGLLPTPAAQEPGWTISGQVEVVDKDGNTPSHWNQRWYDKSTGRLVQRGITQVAQMWPTPNASAVTGGPGNSGRDGGLNLRTAVKVWPTPTTRDWRSGHSSEETHNKNSRPLSEVVTKSVMWRTPSASVIEPKSNVVKLTGRTPQDPQVGLADQVCGQLNPDWTEWLMGWPIGWSSLQPLSPEAFAAWLDGVCNGTWWPNEPDIPRVAKGVQNRTDRLKAIGNGQASPVVAAAWELLTG